jgi:tetratricopeptide (TPR) repeat protein
MKKLYWLVPLAFLLTLGLAGNPAFGMNHLSELYKQGIEDLQNSLYAEAIEKLEQASADAASITDADEVVAQIRYALGYAHAKLWHYDSAITVLDELVTASPESKNGRYLLGVSLIRTMESVEIERGMEVLHQLARENPGSIATISANAAARLRHTQSTIDYASGDADSALAGISDLMSRFSRTPAPTKPENFNIQYSVGVYLMATDDLPGAQFEFDYLALKQPEFALNNGTTVNQVRSNLYYQSALNRLKEGGKLGGEGALNYMEQADKLGGGNKAANHHLKALAHGLAGNEEEQAKEYAAVAEADSEYAARIAAP